MAEDNHIRDHAPKPKSAKAAGEDAMNVARIYPK